MRSSEPWQTTPNGSRRLWQKRRPSCPCARLIPDPDALREVRERFRADWDRFLVVPVDPECLSRAGEIGCTHGLRTLDAIHLAAAARLPPPVIVMTFDIAQIGAATAMGMLTRGTDPKTPRA